METRLSALNNVLSFIKQSFVGKDEIIDLLAISLIAKENAFLLGPPGTAKSAIIRLLSDCIKDGNNFEYLLTRFTEPNEIFGPFDIRRLKEGDLITNTEGMMPEASMVFLDEIFNANSAILNSLLMALNERIFRRGKETRILPALMFVGASNILPEDDALNALLDRFLVRIKCDYVDTDLLEAVLITGWNLDKGNIGEVPKITPDDIIVLQKSCRQVNMTTIRKEYIGAVHTLRNTGVRISDRRAVKIQNLIAASALLCGRSDAVLSDLWVMKHIWDTEEQIELLAGIIDTIIENDNSGPVHPQAMGNKIPNAEEIVKEIILLDEKWNTGNLTSSEKNIIKDKLRYIQSRSNWIKNNEHKKHIEAEIESLWQKILRTL